MNTAQKKVIRQYVIRIKSFFPTFYPMKKRIISELKQSLDCYYMDHPDFSMDELYDEFGSPQEYVSSIINNTPDEELVQNIKMKKRTAFISCLILVFILGVGIASAIMITKITSNLATSQTIVITEEEIYTLPDN